MGDQLIRRAENALRAAVVLFEPDDFHRGKVPFELEDVANRRTAPAVNRLVGIARHGQIRVVDGQSADDGVLRQIRVLVLVDQDVSKAFVQRSPQLVVFPQQRGDMHQQVVEIHRIGGEQPLLIVRIDAGDDGAERVAGRGLVLDRPRSSRSLPS